jgi:hypothetical protein
MPYVSGAIISAADLNNFINQLSLLASTGLGDTGYGQPNPVPQGYPVLPAPVTKGTKIRANAWSQLRAILELYGTHNGASITPLPPASVLTPGKLVIPWSGNASYNIQVVIDNVIANKNLVDPTQVFQSVNSLISTRTSSWGYNPRTLIHEFTATFPDEDHARYFFNSASTIQFRADRSGGINSTHNSSWTTLLTNINTVTFGLHSTICSGLGSPATNIGYYELTSSYQLIFREYAAYPYPLNSYSVYAKTDNAAGVNGGNGSIIRFQVVFDDKYNYGPGHPPSYYGYYGPGIKPGYVDGTLNSRIGTTVALNLATVSSPSYNTIIAIT